MNSRGVTMRIAHFISSCQAAGAELFTKLLAKEQIKNRNIEAIELWVMMKVEELAPDNLKKIEYEKDFILEMEKSNISVKFIDKKLRKGWLYTKNKIRELYQDFRPDIVHSHHETVTFHVCRSLSKYNVKLVETIHSNFIEYPLLHKYYMKRRLSAYIAISDKVGNLINKKIGVSQNNYHIIYNGIELQEFTPKEKEILKEVRSIIAIGRLTKVKDHRNLIFAFNYLKKRLIKENINIPKLLIVGDGELRNDLVKLTNELNLDRNIKFLGIRKDIPQLLKKADIYVMSSELEGLSISLIEALASGIAIVATDVGSNDEIINHGKTGLLVPKKDPEKMSEAIFSLINNQNLRKDFFYNSKGASSKFDLKASVNNYILVYKNL